MKNTIMKELIEIKRLKAISGVDMDTITLTDDQEKRLLEECQRIDQSTKISCSGYGILIGSELEKMVFNNRMIFGMRF